MKKFLIDGHSNLMNTQKNLFMAKKNGYIVPIQMFLKYHYSKEHGHTYMGFVSMLREIEFGKER